MTAKDTAKRMSDYRSRLRREGLRPVQVWVPDQRAAGFQTKLRKQVLRLDPQDEADALTFIEHIAEK
ncbi:MAG: DUF3018 family protein [Verrucomicrobia bacterium]|nr:DUF3018 family protein [Verrucomicrobiota bacterium]